MTIKEIHPALQKEVQSLEKILFCLDYLKTKQIDSFKDCSIPQVNLHYTCRFNNKAKSTGLKMLEFNMGFNNIEGLPLNTHQELSAEQIDKIKQYNEHDVACTQLSYKG